MENQGNIGNQNAQQIGENPINQPEQVSEKSKINYWMISTFLLLFIIAVGIVWFIFNQSRTTDLVGQKVTKPSPTVNQNTEQPISRVSNRTLPDFVYPGQVKKDYTFAGIDYVLYQKANMNVPIAQSSGLSGILYAKANEPVWHQFFQIKELADAKNNPFFLDYKDGSFYVLVVDANGAGSGEGNAKLLTLASTSKTWGTVSCFYFSDGFDFSDAKPLQERVDDYLSVYPDRKYVLNSKTNIYELVQFNTYIQAQETIEMKDCTNFQVVQN
ncbi:MAG: hypothetical protein UV61_C0023G0001 [Candidatus Gottesmanbacteria bacterium GW2011_GWB1_43_11]|uniref:Uncharacterized protein n=1 Tax=Candidatus Gottesmanbacteria bacterium GW2011_GWB1_43_11 TaxID=1618446 RepID=A0A0G1CH61_9BACT|nr:MAG: hypothetical protein UV55_C0020G0001 [Candidatus Gottesmanbacteria bacterium GW2011_GWC1_43_10]KKS84867.1 MAG: hypothetical protein UV61_C0023G0001 [Candidatus Gottesmanbacteria bacterium GW2011_GWB1_43_11]OGG26312.1 MAG: hypothetical protein A3A59_06415 [Candidatus Gottesmanbacteria bacterium RIFCSPLOWO2_01_FULL_42_10]